MVNKKHLKIASIQMVSSSCLQDNLMQAKQLILAAKNEGAQLLVLPEYFALMALKEKDKFNYIEQHDQGIVQQTMSELAKQLEIWIIAGTHTIQSDDFTRPYGRCYVYNPQGQKVIWYDKIHLFDVSVKDSQGDYCESRYTKAGNQVVSFESPWGKIGLAVCYDLRFPELFRQLMLQGCKIFALPAAFTYQTGKAHWNILVKARAIENLCYFIASAQGGKHENGRETWGHSCIISPWGDLLDEIPQGTGFAIAEIDFDKQSKIQKEFPVLQHKKLQ